VVRGGRRATVRRVWLPPAHSGGASSLDLAVTLDDGAVHWERLPYWPFTYGELDEDLRAAGFEPASSTWAADVDRYLVTSRANSSNASR
jgi:hypothetical protein